MYLFAAIIVTIMLIFSAYRYGQNQSDMDLLHGFWESSNEFNRESGLHMFTFYIGDKFDGIYPAYLLMIESGEDQTLLINEPTSFKLTDTFFNMFSRTDCKNVSIKFNNLETTLIPNSMTMKFYPQTGKILLLDTHKIYAVFYKNSVLSELEKIKKDSTCNVNIDSIGDGDGNGDGDGDVA
jgi:hypothetical protein